MERNRGRASKFEFVERYPTGSDIGLGVIKPTEIRVNGIPVLVKKDSIEVTPPSTDDAMAVTLTLFAEEIVYKFEPVEETDQ